MEENCIKKGVTGLKNASFWAINPHAANLFVGKKMNLKKGGGETIKMNNIYHCSTQRI